VLERFTQAGFCGSYYGSLIVNENVCVGVTDSDFL
jgi:hypothetical protein